MEDLDMHETKRGSRGWSMGVLSSVRLDDMGEMVRVQLGGVCGSHV